MNTTNLKPMPIPVPEREKIKKELSVYKLEHLEPYILKYAYITAEQKKIPLDWNGLFTVWYFSLARRLLRNIELNPGFFEKYADPMGTYNDLMYRKDIEMSQNENLIEYHKSLKDLTLRQKTACYDYTCGKCKQNGVYIEKKQIRSLDEGKTSVFTCIHCFHIWREN